MRRLLLCISVCGLLPTIAHNTRASWVHIPLVDLVEAADLIVEGTVVDVVDAGFTIGNRIYEVAIVDVTNVLKNNTGVAMIDQARIAQPTSAILGGSMTMGVGASTDIRFLLGQQGTWILSLDPDPGHDAFWVNHPSQFQPDGIGELPLGAIDPYANDSFSSGGIPEPSTILLAVIGALVLIGYCWRQRCAT